MINKDKFPDGSLRIKLFIDSDGTGTKLLLNILNIERPNSPYHHFILLMSTAGDSDYNIQVYGKFLTEAVELLWGMKNEYERPIYLVLSADIKALWQLKGMSTGANMTYPCPFCYIINGDMAVRKSRRGGRPDRTAGQDHAFYESNKSYVQYN